jgi:cytochrome c-type biogenesis protein CcmH
VSADPAAASARKLRQHWWAWAVVGVAAVVLLVVGAHTTPTTGYSEDRLVAVAGQMKCLACSGESVANSQADLAIQMRRVIGTQMRQGKTDDEILSYFAARYGAKVLLTPSASGLVSLVWVIPVVVGAIALAGLGLAFGHWRRLAIDGPTATDADRDLVAKARQRST